MKMNKAFHLPMEVASSNGDVGAACTELADNDFFLADFSGENTPEAAHRQAKAAAHAINLHDELVEALGLCIYVIDMCGVQMEIGHEDSPSEGRKKVGEILAKARGEG